MEQREFGDIELKNEMKHEVEPNVGLSTELNEIENELCDLEKKIKQLKYSELPCQAVLDIYKLSNEVKHKHHNLYSAVCEKLSTFIDTSNFSISRSHHEDAVALCYFKDTFGLAYESPETYLNLLRDNNYTKLVVESRNVVLLNSNEIDELNFLKEPTIKPKSWIGAPLIVGNSFWGVMVVQSFTDKIIFNQRDAKNFNFFSHHVAHVIMSYEQSNLLNSNVTARFI